MGSQSVTWHPTQVNTPRLNPSQTGRYGWMEGWVDLGDRCSEVSFPVAAARLWNSLPLHVTATPSLSILCCSLKSHLFSLSYPAVPAFWLFSHCRPHVFNELLPPESDTQHNPRKRRHSLTLPEKKGHLAAKNLHNCFPITYFFIVFSFNFPNCYYSVAFCLICQLFFTIKIRLD